MCKKSGAQKPCAAISLPSLFGRKLLKVELLLELVHASACIDKLLLAGEEGMALGTDINFQILLDGLGVVNRTASASDGSVLVIGMDALLHDGIPRFLLGPDITGAGSIKFHTGVIITHIF